MTFKFSLYVIIILSSLALGLLYYLKQKPTKQEHYLMAGRNTQTFGLTATLVMTELNPATLIAFSTMGYIAGWRALSLPLVFLIGLLFYATFVAQRWKAYNGLCVSQWFKETYGSAIGLVAGLSLFFAMMGFSATYVKAMSLIFQVVSPELNLWTISAMLTTCCLMVSLRGGLPSIIGIDKISFILVMVMFPVLLGYTFYQSNAPSIAEWQSQVPHAEQLLPTRFIISLICLTCFTYIMAPWYGQKIFSAQNKGVAYRSVLIASICVFIIYGLAVLTTSLIRMQYPELSEPQSALALAIHALPRMLSMLFYALLFLLGLTTLCGVWSAMAAMFIAWLPPSKHDYTHTAMGITGCSAFISYLLGNTLVDQVLDKLILANIPIFALTFALLNGFNSKQANRCGAWFSIFAGLSWGVYCYLHYGEQGGYTWYWGVWGILVILVSGTIGQNLPKWLPLRESA